MIFPGFLSFPLEALLGFIPVFRIRVPPSLQGPTGWINFRACAARSLWGVPGGLGIASAIEPAGGVSPLRGGAGVCGSWSYQPKVLANYRS
jgi:hypothetical protein